MDRGGLHAEPRAPSAPEAVIDAMSDGFVVLDRSWHYTYVNRRGAELIQHAPEDMVGRHVWSMFPEMVGTDMYHASHRVMDERAPVSVEDRYPPRVGHWYDVRIHPMPEGVGIFYNDITERRRASVELARSEERYRALAHAFNNTVWHTEAGGRTITPPDWEALAGRPVRDWRDAVHPEDAERVDEAWTTALRTLEPLDVTYRVLHADGRPRHVRSRGVPLGDRVDGREWVGVVVDVTDQVEGAAALERAAQEDPLTGLPNRRVFLDRLDATIARRCPQAAVLYVDLDRFKAINDRFGHGTGDRLLQAIARRLRAAVRPSDLVSRLSGDEFAVICDDLRDKSEAAAIAGRIAECVARPLEEDERVRASASVGIAFVEGGGNGRADDDAQAVLRSADAAMYQAKARGGAVVEVLEGELRRWLERRSLIDRELRAGFDDGGLNLHFQPIVSLDGCRRAAVEALLRWQRPGGPALAAPEVVAVAEQNGLIGALGRGVLHAACLQAEPWTNDGEPVCVSVNVSARQLARCDELVADVRDALDASGLAPGRLTLEITETVLMERMEEGEDAIRRLRDLGVAVEIDDFGVGYSSLSYLHRLPVDAVKLDRSFVARLPGDRGSARIVEAVVGMARAFGIRVVAEGIETLEQLEAVAAAGCHAAQGYALARPAPPERYPATLADAIGACGAATLT